MAETTYETRLRVARKDISRAFTKVPTRVLTRDDIRRFLDEHREFWRLGSITYDRFAELLIEQSLLQEVRLAFPSRPGTVLRYCWEDVATTEIVQSINRAGYFSHYSAMQLNGLTLQIPKVIYFNIEQKATPGGGTLTQAGIDRAFKAKCRTSSNIVHHGDRSICLLSGGNTGQLGVEIMDAPEGESQIRVTSVERTLIDATIRPVYSGGVFEVRGAFAAAKERVSVNKLTAMLKKLDYTYPYHQAIGFFMERAGYRDTQLKLLRKFPIEFDFYLDYALKEVEYDSHWRIYFPKDF
jgi:hypothetical protein